MLLKLAFDFADDSFLCVYEISVDTDYLCRDLGLINIIHISSILILVVYLLQLMLSAAAAVC